MPGPWKARPSAAVATAKKRAWVGGIWAILGRKRGSQKQMSLFGIGTEATMSVFYIFPLASTVWIQPFPLKVDCHLSVLPTPSRGFELRCRRHVWKAWESVLDVHPGKHDKNLRALQQNKFSIDIKGKVLKRSTGNHCPEHYGISFTGEMKSH